MPEVTFERFRGLDLVNDPGELSGESATALENVEFDTLGRLRTRRGFEEFANGAGSTTSVLIPSGDYLLSFAFSAGNTVVRSVDTSGTVAVLDTLAGTGVSGSYARIGTPTATYTFFATSSTLRRFDNSSTVASSTGKPSYVAAWQARLVQGGYANAADSPSGADGSGSTAFLSDAGDPNTYGADNFVDLSPGDGETIRGMASWRDMLFVFKQTAMFVFYGSSEDPTGNPIFNYRRVDLGAHVDNGNVIAGRDAVYFGAQEGVYRTTGDVPQRVSGLLDPLFDGSFSPRLAWAADRLLVQEVPGYELLVLDPNTGDWTIWDLGGAEAVAGWSISGDERIYFGDGTGPVYALDKTLTDDDGAAISWFWQSGWYDLGTTNSKRVGPLVLWGSGSVTSSLFFDYGSTDSSAGTVTLGTYPAVERARQLKTRRGRRFSHRLSGSGLAVVHRFGIELKDQRVQ